MKRYIFVILCIAALALVGCSEEKTEPVVTYEVSTTEATTQGPPLTEPTTEETESQAPVEPASPYKLVFDAVQMSRDGVGNMWLDVVAAIENKTEDPIRMTQSTLRITANGQEIMTIEDAVCYPNVIEPDGYGYYHERIRVDMEAAEGLRAEVEANVERATGVVCLKIEDYQMYDLAYGIEIHGSYEPIAESGSVCIAAIFSDLNGNPVAIMSDYFDAAQKQFVLSSDKLPEGLHSSLVTAQVFVYEN